MSDSLGFCKYGIISKEIYKLLANELLGEEQYNKIFTRYEDMKSNFFNYPKYYVKGDRKEWKFSEGLTPFQPAGYDSYYTDTTAVPIPITHPDFIDLTVREKKRGAIGLDFPTWFHVNEYNPFIMIISQDPLRDAYWYGDREGTCEDFICSDAIVSSPFGLQDSNHREKGNGGKRIWLLVQSLIKRGYNVYLTDCRKYFVYDHKESDQYTTPEKKKIYRDILKKEIEIVKPKLIVTLGYSATNYCKMLLGKDERLSGFLPHLSGAANGAIKLFFKEYLDIVPHNIEDQVELYAKYIEKLISEKYNSNE